MKYLLDTCTFLWVISDPDELSKGAKKLIQDPANEIYLSSASTWEISIQIGLKRLSFSEPIGSFIPRQRERHQILSLPIDEESSLYLEKLPKLHKDPFDRILVSQALVHAMTLITPDKEVGRYPAKTVW